MASTFKVLYFCRHNSVRAPLAAAITQRIAAPGVVAYSSGLESEPLSRYVEQQIKQLTRQTAQNHFSVNEIDDHSFDLVVVLGDKSHPSPAESISLGELFPGAEQVEWDMKGPQSDDDIKQIEIELSERIRLLLLVRHLI